MRRRNFLTVAGTAGAFLSGCTESHGEENDGRSNEQELSPIIVISSPINADAETYEVVINGQPNRADYVDIEHEGELVYTMREDIEPTTVVQNARKGELTRAIAVEGETKEIIEERSVA